MTTRQLKRHIRKIRAGWLWVFLLITCAIVIFYAATWLTDTYYDIWLHPSEEEETKVQVENLQRAIALKPLEQDGYNKILDIYLQDGILIEDEHAAYMALLNEHQERINRKQELFAPLYRRMAFIYLASYDVDAEARLKAAYNYLEISQHFEGATEVESTAIKAYLELEEYYREYIWLEGFLREPTSHDVSSMIGRIHAMLDTFQQASDADRLAYACCIASLMDTEGAEWVKLCGYEKVEKLANAVAVQLEAEVSKPAALRLKEELANWVAGTHPWEVH